MTERGPNAGTPRIDPSGRAATRRPSTGCARRHERVEVRTNAFRAETRPSCRRHERVEVRTNAFRAETRPSCRRHERVEVRTNQSRDAAELPQHERSAAGTNRPAPG
jgi:hypothetical protein